MVMWWLPVVLPTVNATAVNQLVYNNTLDQASWYTNTPAGRDASWKNLGTCGGISISSRSIVFNKL
ncbi:cellulose-binding domain-containing protein [Teredinibacter franksiae]|uniref:cellulose-binding domain-containing protein n=1 Tax=Teredinibacter franksiae TaxID=2761453 RepID=UPI0016254673|nr:cellulose-binding domain-containing protein [Teredinibacter franksiae]